MGELGRGGAPLRSLERYSPTHPASPCRAFGLITSHCPLQRLDSAPQTRFSQLRLADSHTVPADGLPGPPPPTLWKHQPDVGMGPVGRRRKWLEGGECQPRVQAGLAGLRGRPESTPPPPCSADQGPEDQEVPGQTRPRLGEHKSPSGRHPTAPRLPEPASPRAACWRSWESVRAAEAGGVPASAQDHHRPRAHPTPACCPPSRHLQRPCLRMLGLPGPATVPDDSPIPAPCTYKHTHTST